MKILFLQLSDIHIKQDEYIEMKIINKLIEGINAVGEFNECIVIFSGDLADRSKVNEYKQIKKVMGRIINGIKERYSIKFINYLVVPGNHDADFTGISRGGEDIYKYYKENKVKGHIEEELKMFNNFFNYSSQYNCFRNNKIIDEKIIRFEKYRIQCNLLNTSLFSTLKPDDKQLHYFPEEELSYIDKNENTDIAITIMHHSTEWFNSESKKNLEKMIYNNSSILFLGHDHDSKTNKLGLNNDSSIFISAGGQFNVKNINNISEFNAIILETDLKEIDVFEFKWDKVEQFFSHTKVYENEKLFINNKKLLPKADYIITLKEDEKRKITENGDFTEYFVFPKMTEKIDKDDVEKLEVYDIDILLNILYGKKYINILGNDSSGKTTILKSIYLSLINDKVPIFFSIDTIKLCSIEDIIRIHFEKQYSDKDIQYQKFEQLSKSDRVAIIDDFDLIKSKSRREELLKLLKEKFEYIIFATKKFEDYNIVDAVKNGLKKENEFCKLEIESFYLKKRKSLIKKLCKVVKVIDDQKIEEIDKKINNCIKNQIELFDLNPDFLIQYIQFFLQNMNYEDQKGDEILSQIFTNNIYNAIIENSEENQVNEIRILIEEIAYNMHFNRKDPFTYSDIENVIKSHQEEFGGEVKPLQFLDIVCKAKILKKMEDSFSVRFCNKNQLSFFIAKALIRRINIYGKLDDIEYVLKNICFSINDTIVLFIIYITDNPQIIMSIYQYASELMNEWKEFDIEDGSIKYLTMTEASDNIPAPNNKDKEKRESYEEKYEENVKKNQIIECVNLYDDYDESKVNTMDYKIIQALKYTEMICKALPSFRDILTNTNKNKLIDGIYRYPNKIIYQLLEQVDSKYDKFINELKEFIEKNEIKKKNGGEFTESDIKTLIKNVSLYIILSIYNQIAYLSSSKQSITFLNKYNLHSSSCEVLNLRMEENVGNIEAFIRKADRIFDNKKNKDIKVMITLIVKDQLINNSRIDFGKRQKLLTKYFDKSQRQEFLIEKYRDNIHKK